MATRLGQIVPLQPLCGVMIESIRDYFSDPRHRAEFEEWREKQEENNGSEHHTQHQRPGPVLRAQ